jgi:phosphoadenosine phosphosulfate reductase
MYGLRREEGGRRANLQPVSLDRRTGGYQLSPLFDWTTAQVDSYLEKHALPVHPLYAKHYASIDCFPCTTPIRPGEDARAGRWRHLREVDAGVGVYRGGNFSDGSGI